MRTVTQFGLSSPLVAALVVLEVSAVSARCLKVLLRAASVRRVLPSRAVRDKASVRRVLLRVLPRAVSVASVALAAVLLRVASAHRVRLLR